MAITKPLSLSQAFKKQRRHSQPCLSYSSCRLPSFDFEERASFEAAFDIESLTRLTHPCQPLQISWNGPSDPQHPLNWSRRRKWAATILVSCFTFISPFSSTMITPALSQIVADLDVPASESFTRVLFMTIFMLGYAQGPFVLAPLSEIFGRVHVLQYANLVYLVFNTACGFAQTRDQLLVFRFLSGIGGSAPQALCNGVLADVWRKEERGLGQSVYGMLTFIGPCVAPIVGAYVSRSTSWRWIFWVTSIFDVFVQLAALVFLKETYAPAILAKKAKALRKKTGNPDIRTEYDTPEKSFGAILRRRLILPFIMLFTHPAVQAPSLYRAFLYGVMYLVLSTYDWIWTEIYHLDAATGSLHYIALCIGFLVGLQLSHPLMDGLYARLKTATNSADGLPEWRAPPMLIGGIIAPVGLFWFGWAAQHQLHWIVPDLGGAVFCCGLIIAFQSSQAYITDAYGASHAASASAVGAFLRTMCGFSFPLFAPQMYKVLGLGWGNSMLGFMTIGLGVPCPILLWCYGHKLRQWSTRGL
ncbi:MFS multidrug transporter [Microdochium bolleyi]|uniref:MFS multidrug transporter n=1 Tax=Microdochium bolleyi TaxID=196109 RepID=A0A136ILG0_9PEZI|nr:MFS multidrug transporter [Microdochium bolleyi]